MHLFHSRLLGCLILMVIMLNPACNQNDTNTETAKSSPPNIVLIISDDQAWSDYSFLDHATYRNTTY